MKAAKIITINLSDSFNEQFRQHFALNDYYMLACKTMSEALRILDIEECRLIIYSVTSMSNVALEGVQRIRERSYAPILVFAEESTIMPIIEVGAVICIQAEETFSLLYSQAISMIQERELHTAFDTGTIRCGDIEIDLYQHIVTISGEEVYLVPREFRLLVYFASNPNRLLYTSQISMAIWLDDLHSSRDIARVVFNLRRKLMAKGRVQCIYTVHGMGYKFVPSGSAASKCADYIANRRISG